MKKYNSIFLVLAAIASVALTGCENGDEEVPQLEYYTRAFIKEYGIPDPDQDFNMAREADVTVTLEEPAAKVNLYVYAGIQYYRVAALNSVSAGTFTIPAEIPEGSTILVLTVDGAAYWAEPGCSLIIGSTSSRSEASRDATETITKMDAKQVFGKDENEINALGWLVLVEDLGTTDDFDFNDVIFRIECTTVSVPVKAKDWNVVNQEGQDVNLSRGDDDTEGSSTTNVQRQVSVQAMAAGGTLAAYLHFHTSNGEDYILNPLLGSGKGYLETSKVTSSMEAEWHSWFYKSSEDNAIPAFPSKDEDGNYVMLNTKADYTDEETGISTYAESAINNLYGKTVVLPMWWFNGDPFSMLNYSLITYDSGLQVNTVNGFYVTVKKYEDATNGQYTVYKGSDTPMVVGATNSTSFENYPQTPQMILIPDVGIESGGWKWPIERCKITDAYANFAKWVKDEYTTWYSDSYKVDATNGIGVYDRNASNGN